MIAHRGASGYRPEHTLAAYALAIRQCADVIEPDVVLTKDEVPVARHENEIGEHDRRGERSSSRGRQTTKTIDGAGVTGWFTEDFTLAELRTLRTKERIPDDPAGEQGVRRPVPDPDAGRGARSGPALPDLQRPAGRRHAGDQAPDLLRRPRAADGAAAARRADRRRTSTADAPR